MTLIVFLSFLLLLLVHVHASPRFNPNAFQTCITSHSDPRTPPPADAFYFPYKNISAFTSILNSTVENLRFLAPSLAKPLLIFTPTYEVHVKAAVICAKVQHINLRVRSGAHDYEGLSYVSYTHKTYIVIEMSRLRYIAVDAKSRTAWAQSGATNGELYYKISQASRTLGFPAGLCTTLGLGGLFSGGGYGMLMRMYGLSADNILDAKIVNAAGVILDRRAMGEDLFWAIRGGTGGSFGIVLSWKVQLVPVPVNVTVFAVPVYLEQNGTDIMYKWQYVAPTIDNELFIRVLLEGTTNPNNGNKTVLAMYQGVYLGDRESLVDLMNEKFPELGSQLGKGCMEKSWIEAVMFMAGYPATFKPEYLMEVKPAFINSFKGKSDYMTEAIPKKVLEGMWERLKEDELGLVVFNPFGGQVSEIDEGEIPFCHRDVVAMIQYVAQWGANQTTKQQHEDWVRELYEYMTPYVTSNPRESYGNYRDLDIGMDQRRLNCSVPYLWGPKYFKHNNFVRLVEIKTKVDPFNVFNHELSIPTTNSVYKCTKLF